MDETAGDGEVVKVGETKKPGEVASGVGVGLGVGIGVGVSVGVGVGV